MERIECSEISRDYSFTNCIWNHCHHESSGSCIYLSDSSSYLNIAKSSFTDFTADQGCGGAIYGINIQQVHITESAFLCCNILSSENKDYGGGCIYLECVTHEILILSSSFVESSVPYDGGGIYIYSCSCPTDNSNSIQDCRIINCRGTEDEWTDGGGILAWLNDYNVGIQNTLFSRCFNTYGGALYMSAQPPITSPFITFCFFHDNDASTIYGKDIRLDYCPTNPISYSFTTLSGNERVYVENDGDTDFPNWLTKDNLLVKLAEDNYGYRNSEEDK